MRPSWPPPNTPIVEPGGMMEVIAVAECESRIADWRVRTSGQILTLGLGGQRAPVRLELRAQVGTRNSENRKRQQPRVRGSGTADRNCRNGNALGHLHDG